MKKTTGILSITALIILAVLFTGCPKEVDTVSVSERMAMFIADANSGAFGSLKAHTHPDATAYNGADADYWDTFFAGLPMQLVSVSGTTATTVDGGGSGTTYSFSLKEDDKDVYKIYRITGGTTIFE